MPDIREVFQNLMAQFLNQMNEFVVKLGPGILFAIGIIFVGWIIAIIIKTIISKLIRAFGFDILCEKIGFKAFLLKGEITKKPSQMVGLLFYWIVFLTALVIASEAIDMKITAEFMTRTILYIPKLIVATIFIGLAIFIGRFIYNVVEKTMHLANMPFYRLLGSGARYIIIGFAVKLAIQYLGFTLFGCH